MKTVKWIGPVQEWPHGKSVLQPGDQFAVADSVADSWVSSGHAEVVRDVKPRKKRDEDLLPVQPE